ncbi:uncharacterized protein LOC142657467 [Rhinoderma darwinii]|uniref:uncharacterized protein LOC142657467 n=1 Tax=Rhinoderma darwinii TaxID=43563 RepID=UPI003F67A36C
MALFNMIGSIFQASEARPENGSVYYTPKEPFTARAQRGKLNKLDIGSPTNFTHVTHVGFNAVPGFDASSDIDLKRLFKMAAVKEKRLQDPEVSHSISSVLEKKGSMDAVRKQTRRMTSVERSSTRTRLHSLSSSSLTPSKKLNSFDENSTHVAKIAAILARGSPSCYLPSLTKVQPPHETPPPFSHFPSMRPVPPMPPYLDELSQSFSPAVNLPVHLRSKRASPPPQPLSAKNSLKMPPPLPISGGKSFATGSNLHFPPSIPEHVPPVSKMNLVSPPQSLHLFDRCSSDTHNCIPGHFPSSIPCSEPPNKIVDVPSPPQLPLIARFNSETITLCNSNECLLNTNPMSAAIPPPPPPLAFENLQSNESELSSISQVKETSNPAPKIQELVVSSKDPPQQTNPVVFLDQIKQGIQLKSVTQTVKVENSDSSNIVTALMDVIKRRHKAIHSSDEDDVEDDDWED